MSRDDQRQRPNAIRSRRSRRERGTAEVYKPSTAAPEPTDRSPASEHYHREKARRANRSRPPDHPLEQARRAYHELLASDALKMRGGRPKKAVARKSEKPATPLDETDDS